MWRGLRDLQASVRRWLQSGLAERRAARSRARFWTELRAGEHEAKVRSGS
jgi:hypothetical protein